jgi:hypothetical protein
MKTAVPKFRFILHKVSGIQFPKIPGVLHDYISLVYEDLGCAR